MNPERSFKCRKKGTISIQSIFHLPTLKNITRNCRPDIERHPLRQRVSRKQSSQCFLSTLDCIAHLITGVSVLSKAPLRCSPSYDQSFRSLTIIHTEEPLADERRYLTRRKVNTIDTAGDPFR